VAAFGQPGDDRCYHYLFARIHAVFDVTLKLSDCLPFTRECFDLWIGVHGEHPTDGRNAGTHARRPPRRTSFLLVSARLAIES
jgi:hypothetical protein